jgi:hypothetical protein
VLPGDKDVPVARQDRLDEAVEVVLYEALVDRQTEPLAQWLERFAGLRLWLCGPSSEANRWAGVGNMPRLG